MPTWIMDRFPNTLTQLEATRLYLDSLLAGLRFQRDFAETTFQIFNSNLKYGFDSFRNVWQLFPGFPQDSYQAQLSLWEQWTQSWFELFQHQTVSSLQTQFDEREADLKFVNCFLKAPSPQGWQLSGGDGRVMLDLPSLRLIDLSEAEEECPIRNYTVVFAPRAGHHSNVAEPTAIFLRSQGLSRIAVVEQKCAEDIPLTVDGHRHSENFDGQIDQYREVLTYLKDLTGVPSHLVAVCQPGPLLMATLIQDPTLGKTFGSAGSPMHTEYEKGFLTEFSRLMGEDYIDRLIDLFPADISEDKIGAGRLGYDGAMHIFGFYVMGLHKHLKNFFALFQHIHNGDDAEVERQVNFYEWYNTVCHLPADYIRDTYKKIFVRNELIKGDLVIKGQSIGIRDYPADVPIWAIGGSIDDIAPVGQATGHLALLDQVPSEKKLKLICDAGHMGLFRSQRILEEYYTEIAAFMRKHSDLHTTKGDGHA